jgi:hypothetical protein
MWMGASIVPLHNPDEWRLSPNGESLCNQCYGFNAQEAPLWAGDSDMKRQRTSLGAVIGITAVISLIYVMSILIGLSDTIILALLGMACIAIIWMALRILKDPQATNKTFDDQFYQDRDDLRRCGNTGDR